MWATVFSSARLIPDHSAICIYIMYKVSGLYSTNYFTPDCFNKTITFAGKKLGFFCSLKNGVKKLLYTSPRHLMPSLHFYKTSHSFSHKKLYTIGYGLTTPSLKSCIPFCHECRSLYTSSEKYFQNVLNQYI